MTDVYKNRSKEVCEQALKNGRNVVLESPFNEESFKDLIDLARDKQYYTSLIALFLDNPQQSIDRVANRVLEQNGLYISGNNVRGNFNESFKNLAQYYFYFDRSDFIYTGVVNENRLIMSFRKGDIALYYKNTLQFPQKFADYSFQWQRMNDISRFVIKANLDYQNQELGKESSNDRSNEPGMVTE